MHGLLNYAHGLLIHAHDLVIRAHDLVIRAHGLVIRAHGLAWLNNYFPHVPSGAHTIVPIKEERDMEYFYPNMCPVYDSVLTIKFLTQGWYF